jgi:hypothetical protein
MKPNIERLRIGSLGFAMLNPTYSCAVINVWLSINSVVGWGEARTPAFVFSKCRGSQGSPEFIEGLTPAYCSLYFPALSASPREQLPF